MPIKQRALFKTFDIVLRHFSLLYYFKSVSFLVQNCRRFAMLTHTRMGNRVCLICYELGFLVSTNKNSLCV